MLTNMFMNLDVHELFYVYLSTVHYIYWLSWGLHLQTDLVMTKILIPDVRKKGKLLLRNQFEPHWRITEY